jgi:hypothetical protein
LSCVNKKEIYFHDLFMDASSNFDYAASNEWTTVNNEMGRTLKDFSLMTKGSQNIQHPHKNSKQTNPKHIIFYYW